jgi:carbamoyl-phosphate synthase small subunit
MAEGIDTRAVTVHLRRHGEQKGLLFVGDPVPAGLSERLTKAPSPFARHLVSEVTVAKPGPVQGDSGPLAVVLDLGVKQSLLDHLHLAGCRTQRVPASWSAEQILSQKPDGVVLSNGPGDPACLDGAVETVAGLLGKLPVLGVGLGHELLAMALGAGCKRMPIGHHGVNLPVNVVGQARSLITEQHHSFAVDRDTLPRDVAVTHWHLNDETVEGLACEGKRAFSVQYHPGPDEHGRPDVTITHFVKMMGAN